MSAEHLIKPHTKSLQLGHLQPFSLSYVYSKAVLDVDVVAVTSVPSNLNHYLNYSHNNDTGSLYYEHYC